MFASHTAYTTATDTTATDTTATTFAGTSTTIPGPTLTQLSTISSHNAKRNFHRKVTLKKHDNNAVFIHENIYDNMLKCKLCEDIFLSNKEFNKHAKLEHEIKYLCFSCSEVFQDKKLCGRHITKYHTRYCSYCGKRFHVEASLEKHVLEFHLNSHDDIQNIIQNIEVMGLYSENTSNDVDMKYEPQKVDHEVNLYTTTTIADDASFLYETLQCDSGATIIRCKECGQTYECYTAFRFHAQIIHHEWLCFVCCQVFTSAKLRGKHMRQRHTRDYSCILCSKKYYDRIGLSEHFRSKHPDEGFPRIKTNLPQTNLPQTSISLQKSETPQSVDVQEVSIIHEIIPRQSSSDGIPPYQLECKICKKIFDTHKQFNRHANHLHDCKYLCPFCSQIFSQKELKRDHIKWDHVVSCQVCGKKLRSETGLKKHLEAKHSQMNIDSHQKEIAHSTLLRPISEEPISARLRSRYRKKEKFSYNEDDDMQEVFIHEIIPYEFSSDKKPPYKLKCTICEEIYVSHKLFNSHAIILHDYKFLCDICSQVFSQKALKKEHTRRNHDVACQVCEKKFHNEIGLRSHLKAKHNQISINSHQEETTYLEEDHAFNAFNCQTCRKEFRNETSLMNHCRSKKHQPIISISRQEETTYSEEHVKLDHTVTCQVCKKVFSNEMSLMNHCRSKNHHQSHQEETAYSTLLQSTLEEPISARLRSKNNKNFLELKDSSDDDEYGKNDNMKQEESEYRLRSYAFRPFEEDIDSFFDDDDRISINYNHYNN
ncbi:hypothetical protein C1645_766431 [Glomus cerebriforme]|uniref:C2H2-type domain-containing protein n=1 Tax=Glomus cerebriforme TaxID=658196 RepID=A0A397T3G9_9GLOM|nr:hypothetical protein C1645_766431 [Glomus cerebriforme]